MNCKLDCNATNHENVTFSLSWLGGQNEMRCINARNDTLNYILELLFLKSDDYDIFYDIFWENSNQFPLHEIYHSATVRYINWNSTHDSRLGKIFYDIHWNEL